MRRASGWLVVLGALALTLTLKPVSIVAQSTPHPDVIYGDDDRLDLYQVQSEVLLSLADSTVGLFRASSVRIGEDGVARLSTSHYGSRYSLCQDEPFREQYSGAFCSGSLVGPDLLMTAGHCVKSQSACESTKFVFGFAIKTEGDNPQSVPAADVYGCAQLIGREQSGADWALIKLDRPVAGHYPLKVSREGTPPKGTQLFVIGHPAGLPTKVAGGAWVRDPEPDGYFVANLDTYGGNSGSAVFNAVTGRVEGILVRGARDFVWDSENSCRRSNVCDNEGCTGEDVTKVGELTDLIPDQGPASAFKKPGPAFTLLRQLAAAAEK